MFSRGGYASVAETEAQPQKKTSQPNGKPEAYRTVLRQSRKTHRTLTPISTLSCRWYCHVGIYCFVAFSVPVLSLP